MGTHIYLTNSLEIIAEEKEGKWYQSKDVEEMFFLT